MLKEKTVQEKNKRIKTKPRANGKGEEKVQRGEGKNLKKTRNQTRVDDWRKEKDGRGRNWKKREREKKT